MTKNEILQFNHSNIQELIRFIDQKSGALLIIYGFLFSATVEFAKKLFFVNPFELSSIISTSLSLMTLITGLFLILLLIYQIYVVLFKVIKPRQAQKYTHEENSILYYQHISMQEKNEYIRHINNLDDEDFEITIQEELSAQVYEISCIMKEKSRHFNSVLKYLFISIFLLLFFIFFSSLI